MHHLTLEQRSQIEESLSSGLTLRQIGEIVGVHASTVSRELRRNNIRGRYNYVRADEMSASRRRNASTQFKKIKNQLENRILKGLRNFWSPEQISGRLKLEGVFISHEAIYQYVRKKGLRFTLRHGGKKYKEKKTKEAGVKCIPGRVDISERPSVVDEKRGFGRRYGHQPWQSLRLNDSGGQAFEVHDHPQGRAKNLRKFKYRNNQLTEKAQITGAFDYFR